MPRLHRRSSNCMVLVLPTRQPVWPIIAISLPPLTAQARASERMVLLSGPVMMLPAFRSQMNWFSGTPSAPGIKELSRGSIQVSATMGSSSAKSAGCNPAFASPPRARWLASITASKRRMVELRRRTLSSPQLSDRSGSFGPPNEKIDQRANEVQEKYHQHPRYLFAIANPLVGDGVDQHPNPKDECRQSKKPGNQHEKQPEQPADN